MTKTYRFYDIVWENNEYSTDFTVDVVGESINSLSDAEHFLSHYGIPLLFKFELLAE